MRAPSVSLQYGLKSTSQAGEISVVETAVVEVLDELAEQPLPVAASGCEPEDDHHPPLDDLHGGKPRGRRPALLPCAVAAGG